MSTSLKAKVISLASAVERRSAVFECLSQRTDLDWTFFNALGPHDDPPLGSCEKDQISRFGRPLTVSEIGCFKSHYQILLDHSLQDKDAWLLVLEDDIWIDPSFDIQEVLDFCNKNKIDYCRLFAKSYKPARVIGWISGFRQIIRFKTDPYGAQAYLINISGAKTIVSGLTKIVFPIDDELGRFWRHDLPPFSVFPFPVVERNAVSQIEAHRNQSNTTRIYWRIDLLSFRIAEKIRKTIYNLRLDFGQGLGPQ